MKGGFRLPRLAIAFSNSVYNLYKIHLVIKFCLFRSCTHALFCCLFLGLRCVFRVTLQKTKEIPEISFQTIESVTTGTLNDGALRAHTSVGV